MAVEMRIRVNGDGVIGLACARALQKSGASVTVAGRTEAEQTASWAAAGMLAPSSEIAEAGPAMNGELAASLRLARRMWPRFAAMVECESQSGVGFVGGPTWWANPPRALGAPLADRPSWALSWQRAGRFECDGQVDNRRLLRSLRVACERAGVAFVSEHRATSADIVLDAVGLDHCDCVPIKGQALSVTPWDGAPNAVVRSTGIYIVPKADRVVIGATVEPGCDDMIASVEDTDRLLDAAAALLPGIRRATVSERWAGVRPATRDGLPVIGWSGPTRFTTTGFGRHGILLAPLAAHWAAQAVLEETTAAPPAFAPGRAALAHLDAAAQPT